MATENEILDVRQTRKRYSGKLIRPSWAVEQAESRTRTAGNTLLFIAFYYAAPSTFHYLTQQVDGYVLFENLVIAAIFVGCFFLSRKHPIAAFGMALGIYWALLGLIHFWAGYPFFQGSLWKFVFSGVILIGLGNAIYANFKRDELRRMELKYPRDVHLEED